jgi:site-specific recombinase XerD
MVPRGQPDSSLKSFFSTWLNSDYSLEVAQRLAGHADASTTKLYDRRKELFSKEEVEKIGI